MPGVRVRHGKLEPCRVKRSVGGLRLVSLNYSVCRTGDAGRPALVVRSIASVVWCKRRDGEAHRGPEDLGIRGARVCAGDNGDDPRHRAADRVQAHPEAGGGGASGAGIELEEIITPADDPEARGALVDRKDQRVVMALE